MIPFGDAYAIDWSNGVYRLEHLVELFIPTQILAAAASSEANTNFPASALIDGDRSHLNAGPFDATEFGYGPADNLIGKGLWLGKHIISDPEFTFDNRNAWLGQAYVTSDYYDTVFNWTNPKPGTGSGADPGGPVFWWRCGDTHRDVMPRPSTTNLFADIASDSGPNAWDGIWQQTSSGVATGSDRVNHYLGYPGLIVGDDTASAHLERQNPGPPFLAFKPNNAVFGDGAPWRDIGDAFTVVAWVKNVTQAGESAYFAKAAKVSVSGGPPEWVGLKMTITPVGIGGLPSAVTVSSPSLAGPYVASSSPLYGGLGKAFNLNDGNVHMIAVSIGKPTAGQPAWEIYVDGVVVAKRWGLWPSEARLWPENTPAWISQYPWSQGGPNYNHVGEIQDVAIFDYTFMGAEQPDYAPGLVFYNRQKRAYELGAVGTPQPPAPVPPVFNNTTVVGDKLEVDFIGGTTYAEGFDPADEGEKIELFDTGWVKVPVGNNAPNFLNHLSQMALAQSVTLPPSAGGKSLKLFCKQAAYVEGYELSSVTFPNQGQVQAALWEHAIPTPATSGKVVFDAMIHQQGINPGQGHFMVGLWEGTPTAGLGFKFIMSEATHNFHISLTPPPTTDRLYQTHIFAGDGVNTGVAWAYDTWYRVSVEFNVTAGLVRLFVDDTFIGQIAGLTLTTGINKLQLWHKADDRLPVEFFGSMPAYLAQEQVYGTILTYIDDLRIGSGCFALNATYERVVELGGFPIGDAFFSFTAEALTISDPPFTYTPYWSFQASFALSAGGPWSTPVDIYLNPGKTSSATDVVFNPQGAPYTKIIAKHNTDGGECIDTAALLSMTLKYGKLAQGLRLQTSGEPVGRLIIYTDPDLGGIKTFQVQRGDDLANPFITLSGDEILKVQAFEKYNGQSLASWNDAGEITVSPQNPSFPTSIPSVIIVDFKRNYSSEDAPETNWLGLLILDAGTSDDFPRATEIEAYARYDVTDACESFDITHQADVNFERVDARIGTVVLRNERKRDGTLTFTKGMFQKTASGQTALDMTAEIEVSQGIAGELKQLAWLGVDDPAIKQDTYTLTLACRGRHERLLIEKFPSAFKVDWRNDAVVPYLLALCNVAEGFYALRDMAEVMPVFAPTRSGWDELSDILVSQRESGIFFGSKGILSNLKPLVPTVLGTYNDADFFHQFTEHVSREQAGKPAALHAVEVEVHQMGVAPNTLVFLETAASAQAAERLIQIAAPVDPLTMFNQWSPLQITRAHPRYPKIANTAVGGIITGTIKTDAVTAEMVPSVAAPTDDPNRIVTIKVSNIYVITPERAREIALDTLALTERATNWVNGEQPATPHLEIGDIYDYALPTRALDQEYRMQKVTHTMRTSSGDVTARVTFELTETTV